MSGRVLERPARHQAHDLAPPNRHAVGGGFARHGVKDRAERSRLEIRQVHRDLCAVLRFQFQAHRFNTWKAAARGPDLLCNLFRERDVGRVQVDIISNQKFARAHHRRAGSRVEGVFAEVGPPIGIRLYLLAHAFELPLADVLKISPLRPARRGLVKKGRDLKAPPGSFRHLLGDAHAIVKRHAEDRDKGDDVGRSQPRVRALLMIQINQVSSLANAAQGGLADGLARPGQGDDRAVVVGVHLLVEQVNLRHGEHGLDNRLHFGFVPAFAEVWNAFDDGLHNSNLT